MLAKVLAQHPIGPHENIQRILGVNFNADRLELFILQEFVEGSKLSELIEQAGRIAPEQAVEYMKGIASGLAHLHAAGLCHRDLCASSIIVCKGSRTVKVSGYLARRALLPDDARVIQAPEFRSRPNFESKSGDLWCLGRIVLEMLFGGNIGRLEGTLSLVPSESLRQLCDKLLSDDPQNRPAASEITQCQVELRKVDLNVTSHALPTTPSPKPSTPTPPSPASSTTSRY